MTGIGMRTLIYQLHHKRWSSSLNPPLEPVAYAPSNSRPYFRPALAPYKAELPKCSITRPSPQSRARLKRRITRRLMPWQLVLIPTPSISNRRTSGLSGLKQTGMYQQAIEKKPLFDILQQLKLPAKSVEVPITLLMPILTAFKRKSQDSS